MQNVHKKMVAIHFMTVDNQKQNKLEKVKTKQIEM